MDKNTELKTLKNQNTNKPKAKSPDVELELLGQKIQDKKPRKSKTASSTKSDVAKQINEKYKKSEKSTSADKSNKPDNSSNGAQNNTKQKKPRVNQKSKATKQSKTVSHVKTSPSTVTQRVDNKKTTRTNSTRSASGSKKSVKVIPLGGLNEIGKNITAYEYDNEIIIVDCGLAFPDSDMLGVDIVIPDFTYLEKNYEKIKGVFITHGHEDHIGAIPYLMKKINVPVYGTRLTLGLIEGKLREHGLLGKVTLNVVKGRSIANMGHFQVECINVNHSIPDAVALAIHTPEGVIIHTGDFKIDFTPINGEVIDLARFAELGSEGVICLLSDSTNAERAGSTVTEQKVGQSFRSLFNNAKGKRIIIASFASNIHRIQQIMNCAVEFGRKVAVSGRSMENVVEIARNLGYLDVDESVIIDVDAVYNYPSDQVVIVTTGSQGEPMAALSRMATGDHRKVSVSSEDFIIISATPIPGNEKHVTRVINALLMLGAEVIYQEMYDVHVSGHACQDELRTILSLTKPKFFLPVHGEYKHRKAHAAIARSLKIPDENIHIGENGGVIQFHNGNMDTSTSVEAGRILVDGLGVGDVGSIVLRDRRLLSQDGLIIVVVTIESSNGSVISGPDIVSRGFVYVRESEELMDEAKNIVKKSLDDCFSSGVLDWTSLKIKTRDELSSFIYKKTRRSPMILPIIMEI